LTLDLREEHELPVLRRILKGKEWKKFKDRYNFIIGSLIISTDHQIQAVSKKALQL
jgi:hypothetical protein